MKKLPLFKKTFISYIVFILFIVFIIGMIFNYSVLGYLENEISKSGIGRLKVSRNNNGLLADSIMNNAVKISLSPHMNPGLLEAIKMKGDLRTAEEQMMFKNIFDILSEVERTNDGIHSVYLYLEDAGFIFSTRTGMDNIENFCDTDWLKQYKENKLKGIRSSWLPGRMPGNSINSAVTPDYSYVISYIYSLTSYTTQLRGAIVINLFEDRLSSLINSKDLDNEGYIYIMNPAGDVVTHVDKSLLGRNMSEEGFAGSILAGKSEEGYIVADTEKTRRLITYYKSDLYGWIYIGVFSLDTIMSRVKSLRQNAFYVLLAIVVIGGTVAYFISKRLYSPVRKLVQDIKALKGIDMYEEKNEVTLLSKAFDTIVKQDGQLYNTLEKSRKEIRNGYLTALLSSSINQYEEIELNILNFVHRYFFCIVVTIDRYRDFAAAFPDERKYYFKTLITSVFEEVLNRSFVCAGLQMEKDNIVLIVNTDEQDYKRNLKFLRNDFTVIKKEISRVLDNTLTISIGSIQDSISGISTSYSQALDFLKLRLISGHNSIIIYNEGRFDERRYNYPFTQEKHILNNLSICSKSGILSSVGEFIDDIKTNNELSYDNTVLMLNQLLASTVRYLLDSNISMGQVFGNSFNIYRQLLDNETLDEIGLWLAKIYLEIIEFSNNQRADNKNYIDEAVDYIHRNYNSDININALAESIGISYSQLRRAFIREKGDNLVNYINKLRIEEAKRLLLHSGETMADLAASLGYNSDRTFNRFFKKYEGITPGEFRRVYKKQV